MKFTKLELSLLEEVLELKTAKDIEALDDPTWYMNQPSDDEEEKKQKDELKKLHLEAIEEQKELAKKVHEMWIRAQ